METFEQTKIMIVKGDITKNHDVQAIVNAAHPGKFDVIKWVLFDDRTLEVYEKEFNKPLI